MAVGDVTVGDVALALGAVLLELDLLGELADAGGAVVDDAATGGDSPPESPPRVTMTTSRITTMSRITSAPMANTRRRQ